MKNLKNALSTLILFTFAQLPGAERPQNLSPLQALPHDLKGYLMPFIASGDVERGIVTAASISRSFHNAINDPSLMRAILDWVLANARYTAHAVDLAERLQKKHFLLPVMKDQQIVNWISKTKARLQNGKELFKAIQLNYELEGEEVEKVSMEEITDLLKNKNINLNWTEFESGISALKFATDHRYINITKVLLDAGTNPNIQDKNGTTPLMDAAAHQQSEIARLLLNAKANPNIQDNSKQTALHYNALKYYDEAMTKMLLNFGANPAIKNSEGLTAENIVRARYEFSHKHVGQLHEREPRRIKERK